MLAGACDEITAVKTAVLSSSLTNAEEIDPNANKHLIQSLHGSLRGAHKWQEKMLVWSAMTFPQVACHEAIVQLPARLPLLPKSEKVLWERQLELILAHEA